MANNDELTKEIGFEKNGKTDDFSPDLQCKNDVVLGIENKSDYPTTRDENEKTESEYAKCGIGPWRPACMKKCSNILTFTLIVSVMLVVQGAGSTYLNSILTTLEKSFKTTSAKSGFITSANDIGFLFFVVPASYLASRSHKPFVIAMSCVLVGLAWIFCSLSNFIFNQTLDDYNRSPENDSSATVNVTSESAATCSVRQTTGASDYAGTVSYGMMIFGQLVDGIASSPRWPLTMTFIDENVNLYTAPLYLGILFSVRTFSPVVGFGLGALFTLIPVDLKEHDISPKDPQWIGAWWLGYLTLGSGLILVSVPMFFFPKKLLMKEKKLQKKEPADEKSPNEYENALDESPMLMMKREETEHIDLKGFPKALKRLGTNPIFMLKLLSGCFNMIYVLGYYAFLPKYIENQFELTSSQASMVVGIALGLPTAIGTILSGFLTKRLKMTLPQMGKAVFLMFSITTGLFFILLWLSCEKSNIHGLQAGERINVSEPCNIDLTCPAMRYQPVCHVSTGVTYFSPCQAGCNTPHTDNVYFNCSCVEDGQVARGQCSFNCMMIYAFAGILIVTAFIQALALMPSIMIFLRAVEPRDKALCIGVFTCCLSVIGVPSPVIFGTIIDTVCLLHDPCNTDVCFIYDMHQYRFKYIGTAFAFRLPQVLTLGLAWYVLETRYSGITQVGLEISDETPKAIGADKDLELENI